MSGLVADGRQLVNRAREEASMYKKNYGSPIPPQVLADRMSQYVHYFTLYGSVRPFGTSIMLAGRDVDTGKFFLNVIEPSGVSYVRIIMYLNDDKFNAIVSGSGVVPWARVNKPRRQKLKNIKFLI
jgi:20S proteasome alpha/beta subunit